MSRSRNGSPKGRHNNTAPPLYSDMIGIDERSMSDGEDILLTVGPAAHRDGPTRTTPRDAASSSAQGQRYRPGANSVSVQSAGSMRKSKTRPLHLPVGPTEGTPSIPTAESGRRASRAVMPLFAAEEERGSKHGEGEEGRYRRASLSCVSLSAADLASLMASPRKSARRDSSAAGSPVATARSGGVGTKGVPAFVAPNVSSTATTAIYERTTFVTGQPGSPAGPRDGRSYPVSLHVYDLAGGLLHKYSEKILGAYVPGMYHSAIVCYGMEFYFEGGIGVAGAGRTRFGPRYQTVSLGSTTKPLPVFLEWIAQREVTMNQMHDYHLTRHNCHHFCDDAAEFLLGHEHLVPRYVFTTVDDLLKSKQGEAVHEVLALTTKGTQSAVARMQHLRTLERQASLDMMLHAVTACGVLVMPPTPVVLFQVGDRGTCAKTLSAVEPYLEALVRKKVLKSNTMKVYKDLTKQLATGDDTLYGHNVTLLADMFAEVLVRNPVALWGPPLNALRIAVLHKSVAAAVVFHPRLSRLLMLGARDFPRLLPDGRLALLRLLCNFSSSPHGALALQDGRLAGFWVSAVGQGLQDENGAIVYTTACLANNLAVSMVTLATPSLRRTLSLASERHPFLCLLTICLYNVNHTSPQELPEPAFNMLLLAILKIMASNTVALDKVVEHTFRLRYTELLKRSETNESRALLCILKTLEDLYRW